MAAPTPATVSGHSVVKLVDQPDDTSSVEGGADPGHDSVPQLADAAKSLPRIGQVQWDHYYMQVALTVRTRANCLHALVGAVLVLENRIVSTGFNGTPAGFTNCRDGGCVRCRQKRLAKDGRMDLVTDPELTRGPKQLDLCICVHAEANALLSAAKFGNQTEGSTLYATHKPCFSCLKEACQAGVERLVYLYEWEPSKSPTLRQQYELLAEHLRKNDARNFEQLHPQATLIAHTATKPRDPVLDNKIQTAEPDEAPEPSAPSANRRVLRRLLGLGR